MVAFTLTSLLLGAGALVSAAPSSLDTRASCTFTDAAAAIKGKASCTAIVIKDMTVPAGTTLDLTKLKSGTTVTFQGTTTFGYKEWEGPLISVSGTNIKVVGAAGHLINGAGEKWWDGKGTNGGKKKPKVHYH
jgi:polygalacturonase